MILSPEWKSVIEALSNPEKATAWTALQEPGWEPLAAAWGIAGLEVLSEDEKVGVGEAAARYLLSLIGERMGARAWAAVHFPEWDDEQFDMWWTNVREGPVYSSGRLIDALQAIEA